MDTRNGNIAGLCVKGPALPPVDLTPDTKSNALPSEWLRVKGPALPPVVLTPEFMPPTATVHLHLPLVGGADGERMFQKLNAVIGKVNELEALLDRAGVWVDGTRSGVQNGTVVLVLAPNDPTDAVETCKRVADYLFAASQKGGGITVKVFAADQPETPVYELPLAA